MRRRSSFHYPDVLLAATIEERDQMGLREVYYIAKNLKRDGKEFVKGNFSEKEKIDAAFMVCNRIMHEEYIDHVLESLLKTYYLSEFYKSNKPLKMKIVFPMPITNEQSTNALSPVFVSLLEKRLKDALRKKDPSNQLRSSVGCDLNVRSTLKVGRTVSLTESTSEEENLINFVGLLAHQPLFAGFLDRDAIYLLADDSVRRQTTFANLAVFIDSNGGTIGAATALIGVSESAKMQAYPETLKFLQDILDKRTIPREKVNEVIADPYFFDDLNLCIGTKEQNSLTNLEILLLASYFGNAQDKQAFERILELAGSSRNEKGIISDYLKLSKVLDLKRSPGTPEGLRAIFIKTLQQKGLHL